MWMDSIYFYFLPFQDVQKAVDNFEAIVDKAKDSPGLENIAVIYHHQTLVPLYNYITFL